MQALKVLRCENQRLRAKKADEEQTKTIIIPKRSYFNQSSNGKKCMCLSYVFIY